MFLDGIPVGSWWLFFPICIGPKGSNNFFMVMCTNRKKALPKADHSTVWTAVHHKVYCWFLGVWFPLSHRYRLVRDAYIQATRAPSMVSWRLCKSYATASQSPALNPTRHLLGFWTKIWSGVHPSRVPQTWRIQVSAKFVPSFKLLWAFYVTLVKFRCKTYLVRLRRWLARLGFKRDMVSSPLGEGRVCSREHSFCFWQTV